MKATQRRQPFSLAARALKLVGIILIVSYLLDSLIQPLPYQFLSLEWRIQAVTLLVDKGIIAMMGLSLLLAGYWIDVNTAGAAAPQNKLLDLRFWALLLSSLLGLLFLLLTPLHFNDVRLASTQKLQQIDQAAQEREAQLETLFGSEEFQQQVQDQLNQAKGQFDALLDDESRLNEVLSNEQIPEPLKTTLEESKNNPGALEDFLKQQAESVPDRQLTQLREQKQAAEKQTRLNAWKSGLRIGFSSLLLAIGYIAIGWSGLRGIVESQRVSRPASMG